MRAGSLYQSFWLLALASCSPLLCKTIWRIKRRPTRRGLIQLIRVWERVSKCKRLQTNLNLLFPCVYTFQRYEWSTKLFNTANRFNVKLTSCILFCLQYCSALNQIEVSRWQNRMFNNRQLWFLRCVSYGSPRSVRGQHLIGREVRGFTLPIDNYVLFITILPWLDEFLCLFVGRMQLV